MIQFGIDKAHSCALFYCLLAYSYAVGAVVRGAGKNLVSMGIMLFFWCAVRVVFLWIMIPIFPTIQMVYLIYPI